LYASTNIVRAIKSRRMRGEEHIERMGEMRNAYKVWSENLKGGDFSADLGVDWRIILRWILGK
jgi:hypothetical protein